MQKKNPSHDNYNLQISMSSTGSHVHFDHTFIFE